jgi:ribose 5-phosphate isomerase B
MKRSLTEGLIRAGYEVIDEGDDKLDPNDDFPQFAARTVAAMKASDDKDPRGILICGSGQGICIAANRFKGIRAALAWNTQEVHASRNDDDANVLCLPARYMGADEALRLAEAWLATPFAGAARYKRRIKQLDELG